MSFQLQSTDTVGVGTTDLHTGGFTFGFNKNASNPGSVSTTPTKSTLGAGDAPTTSTNMILNATNPLSSEMKSTNPTTTTSKFVLGSSTVNSSATPHTNVAFNFGNTAQSTVSMTVTSTSSGTTMTTTTSTPILSAALAAPFANPTTTSGVATANPEIANTSASTTDLSSTNATNHITFGQLEEYASKWSFELQEQEKSFTEQATKINAMDRLILDNNRKIWKLRDAVAKVKNDQDTIDQELEFITTQHRELQDAIEPLQKDLMSIPLIDRERSRVYTMVENLDSQLKRMSDDLKEIVENINDNNKCQDNADPLVQISKILNAHINTLQWIDRSSTSISNKLEEINKLREHFKKEFERSFRSIYYDS